MHRHVIWTAIGIVVAGGCSSQAPIDRDAEIAALRSAADAYHAAASAKDAQSVVTFYADDAMLIPPNAERVEGIEGVLAIVDVSFTGPDGQPGSDRVRDFHVWKKQDDGSWKVVVDVWNSE